MLQEETERTIQRVILRHIDAGKHFVFLFGSRAAGKGKINSDYDIGVYGLQEIPFHTCAVIEGELEAYPIPQEIDIVDFRTVTPEFKEIALQDIKNGTPPRST